MNVRGSAWCSKNSQWQTAVYAVYDCVYANFPFDQVPILSLLSPSTSNVFEFIKAPADFELDMEF